MARFIKRSENIEAVLVLGPDFNGETFDGRPFSEMPDWLEDAIQKQVITIFDKSHTDYAEWAIKTLGTVMIASPSDYIIKDSKGELYPCRGDVFARTYDKVVDDE